MDGPIAHFQNCHVGDRWAEGNNFCCLWMVPWWIVTVENGWGHGHNSCCLWMGPWHICRIVPVDTDRLTGMISVAYGWSHGELWMGPWYGPTEIIFDVYGWAHGEFSSLGMDRPMTSYQTGTMNQTEYVTQFSTWWLRWFWLFNWHLLVSSAPYSNDIIPSWHPD